MIDEELNKVENLIAEKKFEEAKAFLLSLNDEALSDFDVQKNLGLCYVNLNNLKEAKQCFQNAVKINPEDATSWYYLGVLFENFDMIDEAEDAYLKVTQLREKFPDTYKNLSIIYMKKKMLDKAVEYAKKANELNPEDYQPYYILSSIMVTQGLPDKIIEILEIGLKLNPEHSNMHANIGGAYCSLHQYDKALKHLMKAIELDPKNTIAYNSLTNLYLAKEDFKNAYDVAKKAYELDSSDVFLVTLAMCSMKAEEYNDAVKYYSLLTVVHPEKQFFYVNLANAYIGKNDYASAQDILFKLYKTNPKSETIGLKLVDCCKASGNVIMAITVLKKMLSVGIINPEIRYEYAILSASVNDYDTALDELKKVVKLDYKNAIAHKDMAVIYLVQNQLDYARDEFEQAYSLDNTSFSIVFEYANYLNQVQDFVKSKDLYEKAIELSNGQIADVYLYAAINLISMNELDLAYKYLKQADKLLPDNYQTLANLGKVLFFMGKFKDSKDFCKRSLELKKDVETQNIYATSCMALNEFETALQIFLELFEANKNNVNLMVNITKCYYNLNDYDNALLIADKILAILPECDDAKKIIEDIQNKKDKK